MPSMPGPRRPARLMPDFFDQNLCAQSRRLTDTMRQWDWASPGPMVLPHFAWIMPPSERAVAAGRSWRDRSFALQQLEAVDLSLGLTAAPGRGQGGAHRSLVHCQPGGERLSGGTAARTRLGQPGAQLRLGAAGAAPSRRPRTPQVRMSAVNRRASSTAILASWSCSTLLTAAASAAFSAAKGWTRSHAICRAAGGDGFLLRPGVARASKGSSTRRRPTLAGTVRRSASQR